MTAPRNVAILIFDDVEVLDFCGPFEVFSVAAALHEPAAFKVYIVAERPVPVHARYGLVVQPHRAMADCPRPDLLLVPGGMGTRREMQNAPLVDWIRETAGRAELVLSVCTGALLLAKAGLVDGLDVTTHHAAFDLLRETAPHSTLREDKRYIDNGRVIVSAGVSAGIDMSLYVVGRLLGEDHAIETARHIEYPFPVDDRASQ